MIIRQTNLFSFRAITRLVSLLLAVASDACSAQAAGRQAPVLSLYQPNFNRECVQTMGPGTTLFPTSTASLSESSAPRAGTTAKPTVSLRETCAQKCIEQDSGCIGFNWPPGGAYCILVTQGCTVTPSQMWTFYRKPRIQATRRPAVPTAEATTPEPSGAVDPGVTSEVTTSKESFSTPIKTQVPPANDSRYLPVNVNTGKS